MTKSLRGFAAMDPQRQRELASRGGKSIPPGKRAFSTKPGLASEAGKKGGKALAPEQRTFAKDRALASAAGKKGGAAMKAKNQ